MKINIFWFRRDLRLNDNRALDNALSEGFPVLPLFIFDDNILDELPADDARIGFIYNSLYEINEILKEKGSSVLVRKGDPLRIWMDMIASNDIYSVYINKDYEPYGKARDAETKKLLQKHKIPMFAFKDHVIFEEDEVLKPDNKPYTIFTPYSKKWLSEFVKLPQAEFSRANNVKDNFHQGIFPFPSLKELGFRQSGKRVKPYDLNMIREYHKFRDYPAEDKTTYLSPHLRFGTVSIRSVAAKAAKENPVFLNELIWREFFMQILFHYPRAVTENFKSVYDNIGWRNNEREYERWCRGETGYPIVDAGMRQLNETGYMHNRVRMITSGFLCKHLLIDWQWGEAYFAQKLLDYELSSNNGNWQWAAGTGCDAAPYFRIFNPETQQKKFDPRNEYTRRWVKESDKPGYPEKIVSHEFARNRAIDAYKAGIKTG